MANYDVSFPIDSEYIALIPKAIRDKLEQVRADTDPIVAGAIVNAKKVQGYLPGNATGNIPISNTVMSVGLNAEMLGGKKVADLTPIAHVGSKGSSHSIADASNAGFMPSTHFVKVADVIAIPTKYENSFGFGVITVTGSNTVSSTLYMDTLILTGSSLMSITSTGKTITVDLLKDGSGNANHAHIIASGSNSGFINATMYTNYQTAFSHVSDTSKHYNFGNITVGGTVLVADTFQDNLTINAGAGITLTGDAVGDAFSIAITQDGHSHAVATTGSNGFMSAGQVVEHNLSVAHYGTNHNAYGRIIVASTNVDANSLGSSVTFIAGTGIALTPNATTDTITFAVSNVNASTLNGYTQGNATGNIPLSNGTMNTNLVAQYLGDTSTTKASFLLLTGGTLTGSIYFDPTTERAIKIFGSGINWGMFLNSGGFGLYDWQNTRNILGYTPSTNAIATMPAWTFASAPSAPSYTSSIATGTAPLIVTSTTKVTNLNADLLDGLNDTAFVKVDGSQTMSGNLLFATDKGVGFYGMVPTVYGITLLPATTGGRVSTETASDYNMYFNMYAGANRGYVFKSAGAAIAQIDASGVIHAEGGFRTKKFSIQYNSTEDSLDFVYN